MTFLGQLLVVYWLLGKQKFISKKAKEKKNRDICVLKYKCLWGVKGRDMVQVSRKEFRSHIHLDRLE